MTRSQRFAALLVAITFVAGHVAAQTPAPHPRRPVHTFSIVARDPATGEMGVAVHVVLQRAYNHMNAGDLAVEHKDNEGALREYSAAAALAPGNVEMVFWHAAALVNMGRVDESLPLFRRVRATVQRQFSLK